MNKRILTALIVFGFGIVADRVDAQRIDNSAVKESAQRFRQAVMDFEKVVRSVRGIERADERIVDKFEEQNRRVFNAAQNPRLATRLRTEYDKMLVLQNQAERAIFGQYTPNQKLVAAWQYLQWCQYYFEQQYAFFVANPRGCRVERIRGPLASRQPTPPLPTQVQSQLPGQIPFPDILPVQKP